MTVWFYLFLGSCFIVLYNYAGYALIVILLNRIRPRPATKTPADDLLPSVSFIVAAYNEADCIDQKIANSLDLDYPPHKIEFVFISDGSSDATPSIIRRYDRIVALHQPERQGKSAAINRAVSSARHEILIFSDANTILNREAVRLIARHYPDPAVGGVAGEKKVLSAAEGNEVGDGEGLYWKYESFLKKTDADFYSVVGAAGELFSLRRSHYTVLPATIVLDDFVLSLKVAQQGFRVAYEPAAWASELPSASMEDERKRKVRIAAGGFQAIALLSPLLAIWKSPRLSFLYISHRVLRWAASPFCLVLAFVSNGILVVLGAGRFPTAAPVLTVVFIGQCAFYGAAALAAIQPSLRRFKLVRLAYYFAFMNYCAILGFFRFLNGS
ncbi:MAG TPA: glycosyltransferase family 2 protein, partial [Puia sp.]|nr:glycosyltransferase family 2 protein [Puia sp.]